MPPRGARRVEHEQPVGAERDHHEAGARVEQHPRARDGVGLAGDGREFVAVGLQHGRARARRGEEAGPARVDDHGHAGGDELGDEGRDRVGIEARVAGCR